MQRATLTVRLGRWFEARAAGWGVAAVPLLVITVLAASLLGLLLR